MGIEISRTALSADSFRAGNGTIGETEGKISPTPWPAFRGITVKAHATNTANVLIGPAGNVANAGFVLAPGEMTTIDADNTDGIGIVADAADQAFSWMAF